MNSMTDPSDSVQPPTALAAWTTLVDSTVWSMREGATDPISAGFTRPAWCTNGEPGEVLSVQASSADRVSTSEVAAVPLLAYRGKVLGNHVEFSTARVHLRHAHTRREPTVQLERHWFGQREDAPTFGETDELLTLRPAEARQLGALLIAAADLAQDCTPALAMADAPPASAAAPTSTPTDLDKVRAGIDDALVRAMDAAEVEGGVRVAIDLTGTDPAGADSVDVARATARTRAAGDSVMTLVTAALAGGRA